MCIRDRRGLVDARRLLRADLLPRSVGGIFMNYFTNSCPEFLSRPTTGPSISGDLEFIPGIPEVVDHCNGLLLFDGCVANPATRRWARLPPCPMARREDQAYYRQIKCLAYDPSMSPHYEVFLIPSLPDPTPQPHPQSKWPPSSYALHVFSSMTGCWEERSFALEGESLDEERLSSVQEGGEVLDKLYWRQTLYVLCGIGVVLRISISDAKYRWVPKPAEAEYRYNGGLSLGRSEKGVYCAFNHDWHGLKIFLLNESAGGQLGWELKHLVDLRSFARKLHAHYCAQHKGPWILQDNNYYRYRYGNRKHREVVEDTFEWNSDDDNVLNTEDMVEGHFVGYIGFLGFHPYKEIVFLNASLRRAVAYHWNTSKFQDLGSLSPKEYFEDAGHCAGIDTSFIYTPCWMEDSPENNTEARSEDY